MSALMIVNKSTLVSDDDVRHMTRGVAKQIRHHAAPLWSKAPIPVMFSTTVTDAAPGMWVIAILDDPDQAGVLGWHTEDQGDLVYGRVFARPALDNNVTVSSVLSHEALEALVDPAVNGWSQSGDGTLYATEIGDPVESDSYEVTLNAGSPPVVVSNFVLPAWFDPQAAASDQFDYLGYVHAPFTMTPGGYVVQMTAGQVNQKFGESYPDWRRATKTDTSRTARRLPPP